MAAKAIRIVGTAFPRDKSGDPYPITILGWADDPTKSVGGGPIIPPDEAPPVQPPLVIWGGPIDPYPDHGLPEPPTPPDNPPATPDKPPKEGWNWSGSGWYYVYIPGPGDKQPKK